VLPAITRALSTLGHGAGDHLDHERIPLAGYAGDVQLARGDQPIDECAPPERPHDHRLAGAGRHLILGQRRLTTAGHARDVGAQVTHHPHHAGPVARITTIGAAAADAANVKLPVALEFST